MNMNMTNKVSCDKVKQANHIVNKLNPDRNVTEEEFKNFMHRVTEVGKYDTQCYVANLYLSIKFFVQEKIVKKLASSDRKEQECGKKLADEILKEDIQKEVHEKIKIKTDRSVINKYPSKDDLSNDPNKISRGRLLIHLYILLLSCLFGMQR